MFEKLVKSLFGHCNKDLGFKRPPRLFIKQDSENSKSPLGKTAYYQPNEQSITIYGTGRHCKDMLRSVAHELVHHHQNERGDFDNCGGTEPGYAQNDEHLRNMEKEAYLKGNMLFRDWEDSCKKQMQMEVKNKMKLRELKELIKETITQLVKERVTHTDDGIPLATSQRRAPGDFGPRAVDTRDYKREAEMIKTSGVPPLRSPEYIKAERQFYEECKDEGLTMGSSEHRACVIVKLAERGLREVTDGEQQIEEESIDEAGCDSGKRTDIEDKAVKENEEILSEGTKEYDGSHDAWGRAKKHCLSGFTAGHDGTEEGRTQCMISLGHHPTESGMPWEGSRSNTAPSSHAPRGQKQRLEDPTLTRASRSIKNQSYGLEESKVMTVEKEKALKENYMGEKRNRLFEKLTQKWTK